MCVCVCIGGGGRGGGVEIPFPQFRFHQRSDVVSTDNHRKTTEPFLVSFFVPPPPPLRKLRQKFAHSRSVISTLWQDATETANPEKNEAVSDLPALPTCSHHRL